MANLLKYGDDDNQEETWARVLKAGFGKVTQEQMPDRFRELLEQLEDAEERKR